MILSEALTILKFRLGSRTDADLDTIIPVEMTQAQFELENSGEPPWFLLTDDVDLATVANQRYVNPPADFLLESDDNKIWYIDSSGGQNKLDKGEFDASLEYWGADTGAPAGYALLGTRFELFPLPDAVYTLRLKYYAADTTPSTLAVGATNLWLTHAPDLLLARTGRRMATYLRDSELVKVFSGEEMVAQNRIMVLSAARIEVNRSRSKGD